MEEVVQDYTRRCTYRPGARYGNVAFKDDLVLPVVQGRQVALADGDGMLAVAAAATRERGIFFCFFATHVYALGGHLQRDHLRIPVYSPNGDGASSS